MTDDRQLGQLATLVRALVAPPESDAALWASLRRHTQARIGLGRAGSALPTRHRLELQAAHAAARDAVHSPFEPDAVAAALTGVPTIRVRSAAPDRLTYLQRPDLGRRLDDIDRAHLPRDDWDLVFVVADGLSSRAVHEHAAPVIRRPRRCCPLSGGSRRWCLPSRLGWRSGTTSRMRWGPRWWSSSSASARVCRRPTPWAPT